MKKGLVIFIVILLLATGVVAEEAIRNTIDISIPTSIIVDIIRELNIDVFLGVLNNIAGNLGEISSSNRVLAMGIPLGGTYEVSVVDQRFKEVIYRPMPVGSCNYIFYALDGKGNLYTNGNDYMVDIGVWNGFDFKTQIKDSKGVLVFDEEYPLVRISLEYGPKWDKSGKSVNGYFEYRCK